ncbi:MAG: OB-fold nucleic acid binding domain-containing protein [Nitrososphaeria archaeon]|nr:DNA-binding protein [Nitrososphaerota archaeon]
MKIAEIKEDSRKVTVTAKVSKISEPKNVNTSRGESRVAEATIEDETGSIILNLWNEQIDMVKEGDTIEVVNGYVNTYRGVKRLNVGRYGELHVKEE